MPVYKIILINIHAECELIKEFLVHFGINDDSIRRAMPSFYEVDEFENKLIITEKEKKNKIVVDNNYEYLKK